MQPCECSKHLIKWFVVLSSCEFKAGLCFWLWGRGYACAMEKKETVFLLGGLFGKTAALPTTASLQRAFKECSPLSLNPSILLNELLPLISKNTSPASPKTTTVQPHCCEAVVRVKLRSMGNVQWRSPESSHIYWKHALGTLTFQHLFQVFIISVTPIRGLHPDTLWWGIFVSVRHHGAVGVTAFSPASWQHM